MSPFCNLTYYDQTYQTNTIKGGDKKPVWNQKFKNNVTKPKEQMQISIWNADINAYEQIGYASIKTYALMFNGGIEVDFNLLLNNNSIGTIRIQSRFISEGDAAYETDFGEYKVGQERYEKNNVHMSAEEL